jgi:hypothetical protein
MNGFTTGCGLAALLEPSNGRVRQSPITDVEYALIRSH